MATPASQEISVHTDPSNAVPRRAWSDLSGVFGGASAPSGLTVLQHQQNPDYPGDWEQHPDLAWCQPTFPAAGTRYALRRDQPLVLRYRLIVHAGGKPDEGQAAKLWDAFQASGSRASRLQPVGTGRATCHWGGTELPGRTDQLTHHAFLTGRARGATVRARH